MKIPTGEMPHPNAFLVPVGKAQGQFQGYVAHAVFPKAAYAGVGEMRGDSIHFGPDAWNAPASPRTAKHDAIERAKSEESKQADSELPKLPKDLD